MAIPLGIHYGGIGCAVATGISMLIGNGLIMNIFYARCINLDIKEFWYQIGRITIAVLICLVIGYGVDSLLPVSGKLGFVLKILLYTALYSVLIYRFAMNTKEQMKVEEIIKKIKNIKTL